MHRLPLRLAWAVPLLLLTAAPVASAAPDHTIDLDQPGRPIRREILGQNPRRGSGARNAALALGQETSLRGLAGGLDADTYDWRDLDSGRDSGKPQVTTLDFLREARDRDSEVVLTVNVRGFGQMSDAVWQCADPPGGVEQLAELAAAWVRYTNRIVPEYRQGQPLPDDVKALLRSLRWNGADVLLERGEAPTAPVRMWEIGNEPELNDIPGYIANHTLSPAEYCRRYKVITAAMRAVDPNILVGPQIIYTHSGHLSDLLADPDARIDFISYHPYPGAVRDAFNGGDPTNIEAALAGIHDFHKSQADTASRRLQEADRDPNTPIQPTEWNDVHWNGQWSAVGKSMTHALGTAESIFAFARLGLRAAHFWESPAAAPPSHMVQQKLSEHLRGRLVDVYAPEPTFRLYTTRDGEAVTLWALNFSNERDRRLTLSLENGPELIGLTRETLGAKEGRTSLMTRSDQGGVTWHTERRSDIDPAALTLEFPAATVTIVHLQAGHRLTDEDKAAKVLDLARQMETNGNTRLAKRYYERVIEDHPDTDAADQARQALQKLDR